MPEIITSAESIEPSLRISARTFERLARFITGELGIKMPESKVSLIQSRLLRRVRTLGLASIDEYCEHLFSEAAGGEERAHFINAITTNKTDFFREPQHFKFLIETALPKLASRRLAVWSAACSSGEEPYTLAMLLSEYATTSPGFEFRILATDVSTRVLKIAADGIYTRQQIEPVPRELRRKYLLNGKTGQNPPVRITPALRRTVSFHQLNFMDADYGVRDIFDVIFCRNVMIYFDPPVQQAVIGKLCRNLRPGGYLFVSHSESLSGLDLPLVTVGASCFRKLGDLK